MKITSLKQFIFIALISFVCTFVSCKEVVNEDFSVNTYSINNQSSYDLYFMKDGSKVDIPINATTQIDEVEIFGGGPYDPIVKFDSDAEQGGDVYLLRDSMNVVIEALRLNSNVDLIWEQSIFGIIDGARSFQYSLNVTDELIK